jgi:hypothetical protein
MIWFSPSFRLSFLHSRNHQPPRNKLYLKKKNSTNSKTLLELFYIKNSETQKINS